MSWVKSVASSEDVFDEDVDDISLLNKEWKCNMEKRAKVCGRLFIWDAHFATCCGDVLSVVSYSKCVHRTFGNVRVLKPPVTHKGQQSG